MRLENELAALRLELLALQRQLFDYWSKQQNIGPLHPQSPPGSWGPTC